MEFRFVAPIASAAAATPVFARHPESATVSATTATTAVMVRIATPCYEGALLAVADGPDDCRPETKAGHEGPTNQDWGFCAHLYTSNPASGDLVQEPARPRRIYRRLPNPMRLANAWFLPGPSAFFTVKTVPPAQDPAPVRAARTHPPQKGGAALREPLYTSVPPISN